MKMYRNMLWMLIVLILAVPVAAQSDQPLVDALQDNAVEIALGGALLVMMVILALAVQRLGVSAPADTVRDAMDVMRSSLDRVLTAMENAAKSTPDNPMDDFLVDGLKLLDERVEQALRRVLNVPDTTSLAVKIPEGSEATAFKYGNAEIVVQRVGEGSHNTGYGKPSAPILDKKPDDAADTKVFGSPTGPEFYKNTSPTPEG